MTTVIGLRNRSSEQWVLPTRPQRASTSPSGPLECRRGARRGLDVATAKSCRPLRRSGAMKALQLSSFGEPTDVVELAETASANPDPGQLAVVIEAATINPSDLMLIRGVYGVRPELPAALGAEGVDRVVAVGADVDASRVGERVLVVPTLEQATWRERTVLDERNA